MNFVMIGAVAITLLTYVFAFVYTLQNRRKSKRAGNYVLIGLAMLIASRLLGSIAFFMLVNSMAPTAVAQYSVLRQVFDTICFAIALGFLVSAAFVDRNQTSSAPEEFLAGTPRPTSPDSNPYSTNPVSVDD